jgi:hypothetical protein
LDVLPDLVDGRGNMHIADPFKMTPHGGPRSPCSSGSSAGIPAQ